MRALVVGLGSMGKRRIRLLRGFFHDVELCGVDTREDRRKDVTSLLGAACFDSVDAAVGAFSPDIAFVCTGPLSHAAITTRLLEAGLHVFSEINLVADGYAQNLALAREKGLVLFLSSTPLYRREIRYISEKAAENGGQAMMYQYHVGQYLPDWHPWEGIHDFFAGDRRTNGCRELLAIELPWLWYAFGAVEDTRHMSHKFTSLDTDFPDAYLVTLRHQNGTAGQLLVDVASRKAERRLTLMGGELFLQWGGTPDSLTVFDPRTKETTRIDTYEHATRDTRYADNIIENAYVDELAAFFDTLAGKRVLRHAFEEDAKMLEVIDLIEGGIA